MARKRENTSRVSWRNGRARGDFRDFAAWGGGLEALVPEGATRKVGTTDPDTAHKLVAERLKVLEAARRAGSTVGRQDLTDPLSMIGPFAAYHLRRKAEATGAKAVEDKSLLMIQKMLQAAVDLWGASRPLNSLTPADVADFHTHLAETRRGRGGRSMSASAIRHYHNALNHMLARALSERRVAMNAAAAVFEKPRPEQPVQEWLSNPDGALLLEAARLYTWGAGTPWVYPLVATLLLTGARENEALGLLVEDVDLDRLTVHIRKNDFRRLKNEGSNRVLPLWPQLAEILRDYLNGPDAPKGRLLFPATRPSRKGTKGERIVADWRKSLDAVVSLAGLSAGVRCRALRITYASARLQTLDNGAPVSPWTVAAEMGHKDLAMLQRVYGKLGQVRHRSAEVEYRLSQFEDRAAALEARLAALRSSDDEWVDDGGRRVQRSDLLRQIAAEAATSRRTADDFAQRLGDLRQRAAEREAEHRRQQAERRRAGGLARAVKAAA